MITIRSAVVLGACGWKEKPAYVTAHWKLWLRWFNRCRKERR